MIELDKKVPLNQNQNQSMYITMYCYQKNIKMNYTFFLDICYLRLDFETFTTVGPTLSTEGIATTYSCPDTFKVTVRTST